jgi:hypothetical protein
VLTSIVYGPQPCRGFGTLYSWTAPGDWSFRSIFICQKNTQNIYEAYIKTINTLISCIVIFITLHIFFGFYNLITIIYLRIEMDITYDNYKLNVDFLIVFISILAQIWKFSYQGL